MKPVVIQQYNKFMGSVDNSDNLLANYLTLKSLKWYCKLLQHPSNMYVCSQFIHTEQEVWCQKDDMLMLQRIHCEIYLLTTSLEMAKYTKKKILVPIDNTPLRLTGRHFINKFESVPCSKCKMPAQKCRVCNFTPEQLEREGHRGHILQSKYSSYSCHTCGEITLCISPCFEIFHTVSNYWLEALTHRIGNLL